MDKQRQYELALAALDYCDPASLAVIEIAYYDGWHPVASDAKLRPDGLNKRIQDNLPTEGYCGYISRSEALAAAAEALGLEPVSFSQPIEGVVVPKELARRGGWALSTVRQFVVSQGAVMVTALDALDDLYSALTRKGE